MYILIFSFFLLFSLLYFIFIKGIVMVNNVTFLYYLYTLKEKDKLQKMHVTETIWSSAKKYSTFLYKI